MIVPNLTECTSLCPIDEIDLIVTNSGLHAGGQSRLLETLAPILMLLSVMVFSISPCLADESAWSSRLFHDPQFEQPDVYTSIYDLELAPVDDQNLTGLEIQTKSNLVPGLSIFDHSFDRQSENLDANFKPKPLTSTQWYFDLSGGRINDDEGAHEDAIPQNNQGAVEAIMPTIGYQNKFFAVEFSEQGLAATMITAGFTF